MKFIKYITLGIAAVALTGCNDFLNPNNPSTGNSNGEQHITNNPKDLQATTYNEFSSFVTNISLHDQGTDLYINPRSGGNDGTYAKYTFTAADGDIEKYYKNAYKAINYANAMIQYNGEDTQLGWEGQFLRAWGYYLLTQQFGAVPHIKYYIQDANREYPRTPIEEIYADEISILENLYSNSGLAATNHEGIVSKQAVAALLTQYYLVSGWDLDTDIVDDLKGTYNVKSTTNFAKAAEWAEKAINGIQLTMPFAEKWSPFNEGNAEEIFSFQWLRTEGISRGHSLQNDYIAYWGDCTNTGLKGTKSGGTNMPSVKALYLFEKGDLRWDATFMSTFYNAVTEDKAGVRQAHWGTEGYYAYWNCTAEELAQQPIAYKYWPYYVTEAEAKAELAALKSQTVKFAANTHGINKPQAAILTDDNVVVWNFQEDGTWKEDDLSPMSFEQFYGKADGNGICVKKYDDPASAQTTSDGCYRDVPLYHVSDMYLLAAEAYLLAGQEGKALEKINAVRNRAGLPNLGSFADYDPQYSIPSSFTLTPLDLVLDERARELYAERTRWFDLKRTKQLVRYNVAFSRSITDRSQMCNAAGEVKWLRPIPANELNYNTALSVEDQNPGY